MGTIKVRLGIIIQARMGSSRLPGKILKLIGEKTLLEHIFYRLSFLKHTATVVLATSSNSRDDIVEEFCFKRGIDCFRGSEENVLERYYLCAVKYGFKHIVRLTADNPFTDIEELDNLIDFHLVSGADYTHSFDSLPVGIGAEIFAFPALEKSYRQGKKPNQLEHVNEYVQENPEIFKIASLSVPKSKNRPDVRLTIDTSEDYLNACRIVESVDARYITTEKAIEICSRFV